MAQIKPMNILLKTAVGRLTYYIIDQEAQQRK
jgi:hypothetical protein